MLKSFRKIQVTLNVNSYQYYYNRLHKMVGKLLIILSLIMMMKTQGQEQNGQIQAEGGDDADHVDSDKLITANTMGCLMLLTQLTKDSK